jgi:hypothetical protein
MATSTVDKMHARDNHSLKYKNPQFVSDLWSQIERCQKHLPKQYSTDDQNPQRQRRLKLGDIEL